jgi:hypothetical protein
LQVLWKNSSSFITIDEVASIHQGANPHRGSFCGGAWERKFLKKISEHTANRRKKKRRQRGASSFRPLRLGGADRARSSDAGGPSLPAELGTARLARRRRHEAILPHIRRLTVEQLMLKFSIPVAGDVAVRQDLPENVKIGVGCIDVRFPEIGTPEQIASA